MYGTASDIWLYPRDVATFWKVVKSLPMGGCQVVKNGPSASYSVDSYGAGMLGITRCSKGSIVYRVLFWVNTDDEGAILVMQVLEAQTLETKIGKPYKAMTTVADAGDVWYDDDLPEGEEAKPQVTNPNGARDGKEWVHNVLFPSMRKKAIWKD